MIIEYLTQQNTALGDERLLFVVDATGAVLEVPLLPPVAAQPILRNGRGKGGFSGDDNFRLLSIGLFLPYQFTLSTRSIRLASYWVDSVGTVGGIIELSGVSAGVADIEIPYEGAEFPLDVEIAHKSTGKTVNYCFYTPTPGVGIQDTRISMVNVPIVFNGLTIRASIFAKVMHNSPLV